MKQALPDITIVISSYNRDDKVLQSLERLVAADWKGLERVELLLIDDGSPRPLAPLCEGLSNFPPPLAFRLITQANAGIGATRNRGYREARSRYVIFLDDDILVYPDTIGKLYRAITTGPGPVLFGNYPFVSHDTGSLKIFAEQLYGYHAITEAETFTRVHAITSGLLVVDKQGLPDPDHFYKDDLSVPAAEEYEIVARFARLDIPIYMARHIQAIHNHHLELPWLVQQQFKYGLGTAEAFLKFPDTISLPSYASLKQTLDELVNGKGKNRMKRWMSGRFFRASLLGYLRFTQRIFRNRNRNRLIGILTSAYFWAGYREGLQRFGKP